MGWIFSRRIDGVGSSDKNHINGNFLLELKDQWGADKRTIEAAVINSNAPHAWGHVWPSIKSKKAKNKSNQVFQWNE